MPVPLKIKEAIENLRDEPSIEEKEILDFEKCIDSPHLETRLRLPHPAEGFLTQRDNVQLSYDALSWVGYKLSSFVL